MLKPASPRRPPARAHRASATGGAGAASPPWCAASPASRSCGPATRSTAPLESRGRRAGHLVQQWPGSIARPRRRGLHEGLDQLGVDQTNNRVLSLSDHDGRAAAYRHDRTVTPGGNRSAEPVWTRGWPSQTRRRRPEKSVQTDQLGLRGECVRRRTARFLALPASARPRSFSAPRVHASTAQLSVRHTGVAERLPPVRTTAPGRGRRSRVGRIVGVLGAV